MDCEECGVVVRSKFQAESFRYHCTKTLFRLIQVFGEFGVWNHNFSLNIVAFCISAGNISFSRRYRFPYEITTLVSHTQAWVLHYSYLWRYFLLWYRIYSCPLSSTYWGRHNDSSACLEHSEVVSLYSNDNFHRSTCLHDILIYQIRKLLFCLRIRNLYDHARI